MTLTLILIRHAKSSWDTPHSDHDRPLNKRGQRSARAVGEWLSAQGHEPLEALCSDAVRTRETLDLMLDCWAGDPEVSHLSALYGAGPEGIMQVLRSATAPRVAIIGHNPGIGAFASAMVDRAPDHPRFVDYPTCATTVIRFDAETWPEVKPGTGTVLGFIVPRELD